MNRRDYIERLNNLALDGRNMYRASKAIDGYPEVEGTYPIMGLRVLTFHQLRYRQIFYEPLSTYDQLKVLALINERLLGGHAPFWALNKLQVSFRIFESIYKAPQGRVPLPATGEAEKGVHAVAIMGGYDNHGEVLRFANSWGTGWGDKGYGWLSREYLERYMVDAWVRKSARVGPSAFVHEKLTDTDNDRDFVKVWMMQNPRWRQKFRYAGHGHVYCLYETLSALDNPVEVIEVRNGYRLRLGWAHLHHIVEQQPPTSILKELFVWPSFRRQGYGTLLEQLACQKAKAWHSTIIKVLFHDVDALPRNRAAGRLFGIKAGYEWKWKRQRRPNLTAVGEKVL
jgi:GNAT superfamily N-acetyltransferase